MGCPQSSVTNFLLLPAHQYHQIVIPYTDLCKIISNRLHTTCSGGQTELRRGIHFGFFSSFYTPQYFASRANASLHPGSLTHENLATLCRRADGRPLPPSSGMRPADCRRLRPPQRPAAAAATAPATSLDGWARSSAPSSLPSSVPRGHLRLMPR